MTFYFSFFIASMVTIKVPGIIIEWADVAPLCCAAGECAMGFRLATTLEDFGVLGALSWVIMGVFGVWGVVCVLDDDISGRCALDLVFLGAWGRRLAILLFFIAGRFVCIRLRDFLALATTSVWTTGAALFRFDRRCGIGHQGTRSSPGCCISGCSGGPSGIGIIPPSGNGGTSTGRVGNSTGDIERGVTSSSPANTSQRRIWSIFLRLKIPDTVSEK